MSLTLKDFSAAVRRRRRELGLTQTDLGAQLGSTRQWIAKVETDSRDVPLSKALILAERLGMTIELRAPDDLSRQDQAVADLLRTGADETSRLKEMLRALRRSAREVPSTRGPEKQL